VIHPTSRWCAFEAAYRREAWRQLSYREALSLFEALWAEARELDPRLGEDWREALAADLALARAINGLPPTA